MSKIDIAKKFKIAPSTLTTIMGSKEKILSAPSTSKYVSTARYTELETKLFDFFLKCRENNLPIRVDLFYKKRPKILH
jgi:hypothetical protein